MEAPASIAVDEWMCPLHPEHTAAEAGSCPRCGTPLRRTRHEKLLAAPLTAVIDTGSRKIVFIDRGAGVFEAVEVVLGPRAGEYYQVLRGLAPGDRVVTAGAFLLDAETRLHPAAGSAYFGATGHEGHGGRP